MNRRQLQHRVGELKAESDRLRREVSRMQVNADRVARIRALNPPEGGSEDYQQGVADTVQLVIRALEA